MKNTNYAVTLNGEYVTGLSFQPNGKANVQTGDLQDAIQYTADEAQEVCASIGAGAEKERQ